MAASRAVPLLIGILASPADNVAFPNIRIAIFALELAIGTTVFIAAPLAFT